MSQPPMPSAPPTQPLPQLQPQPWPQQGMPPGGLQPPYAAVPVQQQPKKPKRFGWPTVIITAVAALSLGGIIGNVGDTAPTAEPSATATASKPAEATDEWLREGQVAQMRSFHATLRLADAESAPTTVYAMLFDLRLECSASLIRTLIDCTGPPPTRSELLEPSPPGPGSRLASAWLAWPDRRGSPRWIRARPRAEGTESSSWLAC
jgi:hypothetical protein